jgi:hypothetical protein
MTDVVARVRKSWDVALTIVLIVVGLLGWLGGAFVDFVVFGLFSGDCVGPGCHLVEATSVRNILIVVAGVVVLAGLVVGVVRVLLRRRAWWFVLIADIAALVIFVVAGLAYVLIVGMD